MNRDIQEKLFSIIEREIGRNPAEIEADKPIRDQIALDSMQFVSLAARIELALDIELPISAMEAQTLNEFIKEVDKSLQPAA